MPRKRQAEKKEVVEFLRTVPLFSACTQKELNTIAEVTKEVPFPAGAEICREGETGVGLHLIVEGETRVQIGGRTRRRLGPGAYFGEIAVLDGGPRTATVVAETPVRTFAVSSWNFKGVLRSHPTLAVKLLEEVCRRIRSYATPVSH
jgi:CRP/FNR family transcriptional regulator